MEKCDLIDARVFYVHIGAIPPEEVKKYMENFIHELKNTFDTAGVVFVPSRKLESGWQDQAIKA